MVGSSRRDRTSDRTPPVIMTCAPGMVCVRDTGVVMIGVLLGVGGAPGWGGYYWLRA